MDPAALETRLAEARARRAKVLSERTGGAVTERPAPPQDLPPDAVRPLVSDEASRFSGRTARRKRDAAKKDDASAPLPPQVGPRDGEPDTPAQALMLVHPEQLRPQPDPSALRASEVAAPPTSTAPAGLPRRRTGALLLGIAALAVGAVIGLVGAALVPGLGGWQIVIVRPEGEGQREMSVSARQAAPGTVVRRSDVAAAGEGEAEAAMVVAEAPPTFGRLEEAATAAAPDRSAPPPRLSAAPPEAPAEAVARPELSPPRERAGGRLPRIDEPGVPPQVEMPTTSASRLPESRLGWMPADTPTPAAIDPAWQVPALEVPALPREDRALATVPASPSRPPVSEPGLSRTALGASIVLHHPPDAADAAATAQRALALAGADNVLVREVALSIRSPNVRYYHSEDRQAAVEVAEVVSAALEGDGAAARDFTGYEPAPDRGLIEIWIDGSAPVAARAAPPRANPAEAARERLVRSIEERLRERLR